MKKSRQWKNYLQYIPIFLFALFLLGFSLWNVLSPDKDYSEVENRPLAQRPKPTVNTLLSNEFGERFDVYISDQFLFRDEWISAKSVFETGFGKLENNDILYGSDHYFFDKILSIDEKQFRRNLDYTQQFLTREQVQDKDVYFSLVPSSANILKEKLPTGFPMAPESSYLEEAHTQLGNAGYKIVDYTDTLTAKNSEYIYYRTDHHWTTLGAHYAYEKFMEELGIAPLPLSTWDAHTVDNFFGTYYNKAKKRDTLPDEIVWFDVPVTRVTIDGEEKDGLYDILQFEKRDKYAAFLHSNHAVTVLENSQATQGENSRIVVFKDSYGNSFVPFLTAHFEEVVVVDVRYLNDITQVLEDYPADVYYVMYSFKNYTQEDNIVKLTDFF